MKPSPTQFGMRENTASPRQHASRLAVSSTEFNPRRVSREPNGIVPSPLDATSPGETHAQPLIEPTNGATGDERGEQDHLLTVHEVASLLQVPVSWVYEHTRPRCVNPLPHMKLGKYLRFCLADITHFLDSTRSVHRVSR
jgi:predicted DNA-binding transcriptional regulator AlpA